MSESGLGEAQIAELEQLLKQQLEQLELEIAAESEALADDRSERFPSGARDHGDEAQRGEHDQIESEVLARHRRDMSELRAALARIESGSYGECLSCGNDIGFERLMVQPRAPRCLACQEHAESR